MTTPYCLPISSKTPDRGTEVKLNRLSSHDKVCIVLTSDCTSSFPEGSRAAFWPGFRITSLLSRDFRDLYTARNTGHLVFIIPCIDIELCSQYHRASFSGYHLEFPAGIHFKIGFSFKRNLAGKFPQQGFIGQGWTGRSVSRGTGREGKPGCAVRQESVYFWCTAA